jgi:hypothetical protein
MIYKNVAGQKIGVFAYTPADGQPKTGDAANITCYESIGFAAANQLDDVNPTELDATNMPGWYVFDLTQAESNGEVLIFAPGSATAGVVLDQVQVVTEASAPQTGDAYARLGAPAGASVSADLANVPTVSEFEARTIAAEDYTIVSDLPTVPSAADNATAAAAAILVTPANKLETDASGHVSISGTKNTLDDLAGSDGDTLKDLSDEIAAISSGSGSGTGSYTDTVTDGVNPLDGVRVQLSTDAAGATRVYETYTDALGVFKLNPDPGVYYVWLDLAGYTFTQGAEVTVL